MKYLAILFAVTLWLQGTSSYSFMEAKDKLVGATRTVFEASDVRSGPLEDEYDTLESQSRHLRSVSERSAEERRPLICTVCRSLVNVIIGYRKAGMSTRAIQRIITNFCTSLDIESEEVCSGVIGLNADLAMYIVDNKEGLSSAAVCGVALQKSGCSATTGEYEWTVEIDNGPAKDISSERSGETLRIAHISDFHFDPLYEPLGNAECGKPTCCRVGQNDTNSGGRLAGYWGDFNCDSPWHAIENAIDEIKIKELNVSYVYYTGDTVDHGVWETTHSGNIDQVMKSFAKLKSTFGDIPVYNILGNHEPNPTNVFAPPEVTDPDLSTSWLYELIADIWIDYGWLPESTRSTILRGGYYTVSPVPGFRVIALNNNEAYINNWWLIFKPQDPSGQLQWLADTLLQAENDGEHVHILNHLPQGDNGVHFTYAREYRKIINRFAHIVKGQFNGHTHNDEFRVVYDIVDITKPIQIGWIGGSATTYTRLNPNYRVYEIDSATYDVLDAETWLYNLTLANETPDQKPVWFKSYSFKEEYGLDEISLESMGDLVLRLATDSSLMDTYYKHFVKLVDELTANKCDNSCKTRHLCRIVTSSIADSTQCDYFTSLANWA